MAKLSLNSIGAEKQYSAKQRTGKATSGTVSEAKVKLSGELLLIAKA